MADRPKVFVTDAMRGLAEATGRDPLATLRDRTDCRVWTGPDRPGSDQLRSALRDCEALLCLLTDRIDEALLSSPHALRVISSVSVGIDHIDLAAATARGIAVTNTPGVLTSTTAELTFGLLIATARRIAEGDVALRQGAWTRDRRWELDGYLGRDLSGSTLGLIGLGPIGRAVAARAIAFGMRVLGWSRSEREVPGVIRVPLEQLLAESDFVSLHVASTPDTRGLIDAEAIARMKPDAVLINTARGDIVNEPDLVHALSSGALGGAGLDVYADEPIGPENALTGLRNVVLTPHIGSASRRTRLAMVELAVENLLAVLAGEPPPACVNEQVLSR